MSGPQLVAVWALLALAVVGIPGAALGWAVGRAALRAALDPGRLAPVDDPEVRLVAEAPTSPLPVAGRLPGEPLQWSEVMAAADHRAREVAAATARTEREIADMIRVADARIPWL